MIKYKKGEEEEGLLANTLGTVLSITATIIIIVFIYMAITTIWSNPELEAAKQIADRMESKVNALENGQSTQVIIQGSEDFEEEWYINGWGKQDPNRPEKCFFSGCVCVCKGTDANACQESGICREIEAERVGKSGFRKDRDGVVDKVFDVALTMFLGEPPNYPDDVIYAIPIPSNFAVVNISRGQDIILLNKK